MADEKVRDEDLSPAAKLLVQKYITSFFAIPAALITLSGGLIGFLLGDNVAARSQQQVVSSLVGSAEKVISAQAHAEQADVQAQKALSDLADIQKKIAVGQSLIAALEHGNDIVESIVADKSFQNAVVSRLSPERFVNLTAESRGRSKDEVTARMCFLSRVYVAGTEGATCALINSGNHWVLNANQYGNGVAACSAICWE